jgi:hypothetical protein
VTQVTPQRVIPPAAQPCRRCTAYQTQDGATPQNRRINVLTTTNVSRNSCERKGGSCGESRLNSRNHGHRPIFRLSPASLANFGRYLFGRRWKAALHRELQVDERLIHRWATGNRPVSPRRSDQIVRAALARHRRLRSRETATFDALIESTPEPEARAILLEIWSAEIEDRAAAIRKLARNHHGNGDGEDAR